MIIITPDKKRIIVDEQESYEDKLELIQKEILNKWEDHFLDKWEENEVKRILSTCASALIYGSEDDNTLTSKKIISINQTELPVSECAKDVKNVFGLYNTPEEDYSSNKRTDMFDVDVVKKRNKSKHKINGNSTVSFHRNVSKFNHIRNIPDEFFQAVRVFTKSGFNKYNRHTPLKKLYQIQNNNHICIKKEHYKTEFDFTLRDIYKNYMFLKRIYNIKPNNLRKKQNLLFNAKKMYIGILTKFEKIEMFKRNNIDPNKFYIGEWCNVNKDNIFIFNDVKYQINRGYGHDKILCYKQNTKVYFLDDNIYPVKEVARIRGN